jgi:DnaJ-related protein SCJ1
MTRIGYVQKIHGEGMPIFEQSSHGDLFVEYNVVLPVELHPELRRSESRYVFHDYCLA